MDTKSVSKENYIISDDNIRSNIVKISNLARNLLHIYQAISLRSCFVRRLSRYFPKRELFQYCS